MKDGEEAGIPCGSVSAALWVMWSYDRYQQAVVLVWFGTPYV